MLAMQGINGDNTMIMVDGELAHGNMKEKHNIMTMGKVGEKMVKSEGVGTKNPNSNLRQYHQGHTAPATAPGEGEPHFHHEGRQRPNGSYSILPGTTIYGENNMLHYGDDSYMPGAFDTWYGGENAILGVDADLSTQSSLYTDEEQYDRLNQLFNERGLIAHMSDDDRWTPTGNLQNTNALYHMLNRQYGLNNDQITALYSYDYKGDEEFASNLDTYSSDMSDLKTSYQSQALDASQSLSQARKRSGMAGGGIGFERNKSKQLKAMADRNKQAALSSLDDSNLKTKQNIVDNFMLAIQEQIG